MNEKDTHTGELHVLQGGTDYFANMENADNFEKKLVLLKEKIRELLNLKNVYFLFGAGTSHSAVPTMDGLCKGLSFSDDEKEMADTYNLIKTKNGNNLEECLNVLYSARAYFNGMITKNKADEEESAADEQEKKFLERRELYQKLIKKIEKYIFTQLNIDWTNVNSKKVLEYYKTFYQKLTFRNRENSRICVFTTNNDLFNETALDSLNVNYINGFSGGLRRVFNPATFNYTLSKRMDMSIDKYEPVENLVYLYKMHGSINWREAKDIGNTYFEIEEIPPSEVKLVKEQNMDSDIPILIYPTPTKQDKSLGSPYVDLFREFQNKLLEPHSVLFVVGYSFSDRHVNEIIYRALATNSSLNVVVFGKKPDENEEPKRRKPIFSVKDSRIFIIYGEETHPPKNWTETTTFSDGNQDEKGSAESDIRHIEHFDYIVEELLHDPDASQGEEKILKDFLTHYKDIDGYENRKDNIN